MQAFVKDLFIYPVKSLKGIRLSEMAVDAYGPQWDREWMVVDEHNKFLTQRQTPRMALVTTEISGGGLLLGREIRADLQAPETEDELVTVWKDQVLARSEAKEVNEFLSDFLQMPVRLMRLSPRADRKVNDKYGDSRLRFSDQMPFHVLSENSLADLNERVGEVLPIDRFRPNIVISQAPAYAEEKWGRIKIGELVLRSTKPTTRCSITQTDQATAERGQEPIKTLATYKKLEKGLQFGQYYIHESTGTLRVGDSIEVTE